MTIQYRHHTRTEIKTVLKLFLPLLCVMHFYISQMFFVMNEWSVACNLKGTVLEGREKNPRG